MIYERRINYYETDRMGITHHSNYIRFAEEARIVALDKMGIPYKKIEEENIMIPVLGVQASFKHPSTFDDIICIDVSVKEFTGTRLKFAYTITKKDTGELVSKLETEHCFTDENLKPVNLKKVKPEWVELINNLD